MPTQSKPRTRTRAKPKTRALDVPEGTMEVSRRVLGAESEVVETIRVPAFEGPVGRVRVEGSVTRNMGDYNSVRVSVAVEMPCYPTEAEVDACYAWCSTKVDAKIADELRLATTVPEQAPAQS